MKKSAMKIITGAAIVFAAGLSACSSNNSESSNADRDRYEDSTATRSSSGMSDADRNSDMNNSGTNGTTSGSGTMNGTTGSGTMNNGTNSGSTSGSGSMGTSGNSTDSIRR